MSPGQRGLHFAGHEGVEADVDGLTLGYDAIVRATLGFLMLRPVKEREA